jgi:hypothetical protein
MPLAPPLPEAHSETSAIDVQPASHDATIACGTCRHPDNHIAFQRDQ